MHSEPIKMLIADDSSVVRRLLRNQLTPENGFDLVGEARDGIEAVDLFLKLQPDVVLLDVEMPKMDGVEAAAAIREKDSGVPIVMFSSITTLGAEATLDAIASGANDYVAKPSGVADLKAAIREMHSRLLPKLRAWGERRRDTVRIPAVPPAADYGEDSPQTGSDSARPLHEDSNGNHSCGPLDVRACRLIVVGVSTGGPEALLEFLVEFPRDFHIPIVIVQHMPPVFTQFLAERLDTASELRVRESMDGTALNGGDVWIARGGIHLECVKEGSDVVLSHVDGPPENSCRPAADVLFRSAADILGRRCLGVVMTGMGKDALEGSRSIVEKGGQVLAQDQLSSTVWGMPGSVVDAGLASRVLTPREMALEIVRTSLAEAGSVDASDMDTSE